MLGRSHYACEPTVILLDIIEVLGSFKNLQNARIVAFFLVVESGKGLINYLPCDELREPNDNPPALFTDLEWIRVANDMLADPDVFRLFGAESLNDDHAEFLSVNDSVQEPRCRFVENSMHSAPVASIEVG